jgi:hypothetical protein
MKIIHRDNLKLFRKAMIEKNGSDSDVQTKAAITHVFLVGSNPPGKENTLAKKRK